LVDDEEDIRLLMADLLELLDHSSLGYASCEEAFADIENGQQFDLIVTDKRLLEGISGVCCAEKLLDLNKDLPVVLMTGEGDQVSGEAPLPENIKAVLSKPFGLEELKASLGEVKLHPQIPKNSES
jgi:two-component system cell cycle response regulator CpdR